MCMLWLISEDGKSIKLIKQALAYENKSVTLQHFQKQVFLSLGVWVGGDSGGGGGIILVWVYEPVFWNQPKTYTWPLKKQPFHILIDFKERWHIHIHVLPFELIYPFTGLRSSVGNWSGNRCESDGRSRGREFDPDPVPYFRRNWLWNYFYGHSPPFRRII